MKKNFFKSLLGIIFFLSLFSLFFLIRTRAVTQGTISFPQTGAVTLSNNSPGATSSYTIKFTPGTNVPSDGVVLVRFIFPQGVTFGFAGASLDTAASSPQIIGLVNNDSKNQVLTFRTSGLSSSVSTPYVLKIDHIINPANPGMGILALATETADGSPLDGDLQSEPPASLSPSFQIGTAGFTGKVTTKADGSPVNNAWVNIFSKDPSSGGSGLQGGVTNYNGDYLIPADGLEAGTEYILEAWPPFEGGGNLLSVSKEVVYGGNPTTQDFQLSKGTKTIKGKVSYSDTGAPVSGANVNAFKSNGVGFVETTTDSSGEYRLTVGGGSWQVMPEARSSSADWAYGDEPKSVKFADNTSSETKTVNFTVDRASSTISGCLVKPNGQPVDPQADGIGGVGVFSREGKGGSGSLDNKGCFSIKVPSGTYMVDVWTSPESDYGGPSLDPITVKENQTQKLGSIKLTNKDATIKGTVKDESGKGIANVQVNAFLRDGGGFSEATTDSNGKFSLKVSSGRWMVMPFFDSTSNYALNDPPQEVSISSHQAKSVDFVVKKASATISGTVVDQNGTPVSIYGFAFAEIQGGDMFGPGGLGGPIERGNFSFKVPAGSYTVKAGLAPGSGYTPGRGKDVTIKDGETKDIVLALKANDAKITGAIVDSSGQPIPNSAVNQMTVFAVSGESEGHSFQEGIISNGHYSISVAAGEWSLGYFIDPSSGYMSAPPDPSMRMTIASGETKSKNIILQKADATIKGTVYQPDGSLASGVFVSVDSRETEGKNFFNGSPTDSDGNYAIKITKGTYKVRVNVAPGSGFLSPAEETVKLTDANPVVSKNFTLRTADANITGRVKLNGTGVAGFIYAWSDDGGFAQSMADSSGDFSLAVSKGTTWHVGAHYETGTTPYESNEVTVKVSKSAETASLTLSKASYSLPQALTTSFNGSKPKLINLTDGTAINIPAYALVSQTCSGSSCNVTLTVNPKASLPVKKGDKPIWYGYQFSATDSNGQAITKFNSSITITFPYTESQLKKLGITANDLVPSYWDDTTGTWKKVSNVTVNTAAKTVTISVNHFTDFALTADITSSSSSGSASSNGSISSSSSSGVSSGSSSKVNWPEIYAHQGGVVAKDGVITIVEEGTFPWDSYLEVVSHRKKYPYHIGRFWQVSDIFDVWYRSFFNKAKILYPQKSFIIGMKYGLAQLDQLPEKSLKLAYSANNGKTWKILPSSVLDIKNKTVAALTAKGGYFMLVAAYGGYKVDYGYHKGKVIKDKRVQQKIMRQEARLNPSLAADKQKKLLVSNSHQGKHKKSFLEKIVDFIFRRG